MTKAESAARESKIVVGAGYERLKTRVLRYASSYPEYVGIRSYSEMSGRPVEEVYQMVRELAEEGKLEIEESFFRKPSSRRNGRQLRFTEEWEERQTKALNYVMRHPDGVVIRRYAEEKKLPIWQVWETFRMLRLKKQIVRRDGMFFTQSISEKI